MNGATERRNAHHPTIRIRLAFCRPIGLGDSGFGAKFEASSVNLSHEWHALPPPTLTGNPPTLQGNGYEAVRILGRLMNYDQNMSPFKNVACASCHMPYAGFSGPIPSVNLTMIAYPGSYHYRAGKRTAQRYTYSPNFPVLSTIPPKARSLAETSGMRARPDTSCRARRRAGTASAGRYPGNGLPRHGLHRVSAIAGGVQTAL